MACDNSHIWNVESLEVTEGSSQETQTSGGECERIIPGALSVGMCLMLEFKLFGPSINCN